MVKYWEFDEEIIEQEESLGYEMFVLPGRMRAFDDSSKNYSFTYDEQYACAFVQSKGSVWVYKCKNGRCLGEVKLIHVEEKRF